MANPKDDIGFDQTGRPIAIGQEAQDEQARIIEHPDAKPVLFVAELDGDVGIRAFGPPSLAVADLLDQVAREYRRAVVASLKHTPQ